MTTQRARPLRHVRHLVFLWLGIAVVVALAWLVTSRSTRLSHAAAVARLDRLGLPSRFIDLQPSPVLQSENAALAFDVAYSKLDPNVLSPRNSNDLSPTFSLPYPDAWWARADASAKANAPLLSLALAASRLPRYDRHFPYAAAPFSRFNVLLGYLNSSREVANVMQDEAVRRHLRGDDAGAFDLIDAQLRHARFVADEPALICALVGRGMTALAISDLPLMACDLRVGTAPGQVSPARVRSLVDGLLSPQAFAGRGYHGEALTQAEVKGQLADLTYLVRPYLRREEAATLECAAVIGRSLAEGLPAHAAMTRNPWSELVAYAGYRSPYHDVQLQRVQFDLRFAATALAMALYRADHAGRWPDALADLVPAYLPAIPGDPFAAPGTPLGYRLLEGGARRIIITVGPQNYSPPPDADLPFNARNYLNVTRSNPAAYLELIPAKANATPATP